MRYIFGYIAFIDIINNILETLMMFVLIKMINPSVMVNKGFATTTLKVPSGTERIPNASALSPTEISPGLLILYDFWSLIRLFIDFFLYILNLLYFIDTFRC